MTENSADTCTAKAKGQLDSNKGCRIVYLLGAGATQGCISYSGSRHNLIMSGLVESIRKQLREITIEKYEEHSGINRLFNQVVASESNLDIEHLITFLEESPTKEYREFAEDLREVFSNVLQSRLNQVDDEPESQKTNLFAVLVDMHDVHGNAERLQGFLTLNYDVLLERAIVKELGRKVDYGIASKSYENQDRNVTVLKLHGSFGWSRNWPIETDLRNGAGVWIPPGVKKPKNEYPFDIIWGRARELLDCDVLRIIGCNLGPNDWDLVSLLFSTRFTHVSAPPYSIEIISEFETVERIRQLFPYLDVRWIPELPSIGEQVVSEFLGSEPREFDHLSEKLQQQTIYNAKCAIENPFYYWLTQKCEALKTSLKDLSTDSGVLRNFTEEMV